MCAVRRSLTDEDDDPRGEVARLRAENEALNEQVKLLVQTEQRLYRSRNEIDGQLSRIQRLSELALLLSGRETAEPILRAACDMLMDTFDIDGIVHLESDSAGGLTVRGMRPEPQGPSGVAPATAKRLERLDLRVATLPQDVPGVVREWLLPADAVNRPGVMVSLPLRPHRGQASLLIAWKIIGERASFHREALAPRHVPYLQLLITHVVRGLDTAALTSRLRDRSGELVETNAKLKASLSRLEKTQERLLRAQKLEAIGRLASGVAHDFNNILTVISTHAALLERVLPTASQELDDAEQVRQACDRAAKLTQQLLAFGRKQAQNRQAVDLNATAMEMSRMLGRLIGEHVSLQLRLDPSISPVLVDRTQLEQIIVNLVVNARDAMPDGGVVAVCTRSPRLEDAPDSADGVDLGSYVVLMVADTGEGMDPRTRAQVFEPFFTTKPLGEGAGMGLATVYGTVKQNHGHISIDTGPGRGTCFTILLPVSANAETPAPRPQTRADGVAPTVLVVEDEDAIRRVTTRILQAEGFEVLGAKHGGQALKLITESGRKIDVLVTDVVMPEMDGVTLARELTSRQPGLPVVFVSGHPFDMLDTRGLHGPHHFLQKPFNPGGLIKLLRRVREEARTS